MPSSTPLTNAGRPRAAEPVRQADRLVDRHLGRHVAPPELEDAEAEDVPLDHGHPVEPPVVARPRGLGVELPDLADHAVRQRLGAIEDSRLGAGEARQARSPPSGIGGAPWSSQA